MPTWCDNSSRWRDESSGRYCKGPRAADDSSDSSDGGYYVSVPISHKAQTRSKPSVAKTVAVQPRKTADELAAELKQAKEKIKKLEKAAETLRKDASDAQQQHQAEILRRESAEKKWNQDKVALQQSFKAAKQLLDAETNSHALQLASLSQQVQKMRERGDRYKALSMMHARSSTHNLPVSNPAPAADLDSVSFSSCTSSGMVASSVRAAGSEVSTYTGSLHGCSEPQVSKTSKQGKHKK